MIANRLNCIDLHNLVAFSHKFDVIDKRCWLVLSMVFFTPLLSLKGKSHLKRDIFVGDLFVVNVLHPSR
jgi:hypothetical protein